MSLYGLQNNLTTFKLPSADISVCNMLMSVIVSSFQLFCHNSVLYGLAVLLNESLTLFSAYPFSTISILQCILEYVCVFWC